ncbi:hypothetical protein STENM36S_09354 [Streptomyces tendae]
MGAWMRRRATLEQIAAQERAEQRNQLRTDRRASYAEVIDACRAVHRLPRRHRGGTTCARGTAGLGKRVGAAA